MRRFISAAVEFLANEDAATAVEYALMAGFIAAVIAGAVATIGPRLESIFSNAASWF